MQIFNGLIDVQKKEIMYYGYLITNKLDFENRPWTQNSNQIYSGFIVTRDGCNVMPAGAWFRTPLEAKGAIDIFVEVDEEPNEFWERMKVFRSD